VRNAKQVGGALPTREQDLFRAAVVFAGAGVDSVLKQTLRSCIPIQIVRSEPARGKYVDWLNYCQRVLNCVEGKRADTK
jgi:hypothetical protein